MVALPSVAQRPRLVSIAVVTVQMRAAYATLGVYAIGSVAGQPAWAPGLVGGAADTASMAHVLFFPVATVGYGVLATSYTRQHPNAKVSPSSVRSARRRCPARFCWPFPHCLQPSDC